MGQNLGEIFLSHMYDKHPDYIMNSWNSVIKQQTNQFLKIAKRFVQMLIGRWPISI